MSAAALRIVMAFFCWAAFACSGAGCGSCCGQRKPAGPLFTKHAHVDPVFGDSESQDRLSQHAVCRDRALPPFLWAGGLSLPPAFANALGKTAATPLPLSSHTKRELRRAPAQPHSGPGGIILADRVCQRLRQNERYAFPAQESFVRVRDGFAFQHVPTTWLVKRLLLNMAGQSQ